MHALGPLCREHHQAKRHILRFVNGAISWVTWVFEIFIYIQIIIRGLCEGTWCERDAVYIYLTPQESDLEGYGLCGRQSKESRRMPTWATLPNDGGPKECPTCTTLLWFVGADSSGRRSEARRSGGSLEQASSCRHMAVDQRLPCANMKIRTALPHHHGGVAGRLG